jgi:hypothetical protein
VREHHADLERPHVERHGARLQSGQVQQLRHQATQTFDLREHRPDRVRIGGLHAVGDVLELGLQRADRRAQLVRDVGDEVLAVPLDLGQLRRHDVEGPRQVAHLVRPPAVGDPHRVVAAGHRRRAVGHLAQRARQPARHDLDERERQRGGEQRAEHERQPRADGDERRDVADQDPGEDDHAELDLDRGERGERVLHATCSSNA